MNTLYAIVPKAEKKPRISVWDLYDKTQIKDMPLTKHEKIVKVKVEVIE